MNIIEAIRERRSVRSFDGKPLSQVQKSVLEQAVCSAFNPFGGNVSIRLREFDIKGEYRPGTYGVIKGAVDFFLIALADDKASALAAGFVFEQIVLRAWQCGLGTCWIAGTFKESDFNRNQEWPAGEKLKIVCPVGIATKASIREKLTRLAMGSKNRKPFEELFLDGDSRTPLSPDSYFGQALEMLRLAPSARNSQPWRAIVCGNKVHFYYVSNGLPAVLNCGIGLCHFYEARKFSNADGVFKELTSAPVPPANWTYLISYSETSGSAQPAM